jgi:NTP pyrophosphatase (non-canonical NTP hydrolase)
MCSSLFVVYKAVNKRAQTPYLPAHAIHRRFGFRFSRQNKRKVAIASPHSTKRPRMSLTLSEFQQRIREVFGAKDASRGIEGTFMWFMEEVGELSAALRHIATAPDAKDDLALEFADVLAWLVTLANIAGVDLDSAVEQKYGKGCPKCVQTPCICIAAKP